MNFIDLQKLASRCEPNESRMRLPDPQTRLGEAVTDLLSILHEQEKARWGLLELIFMSAGDLEKKEANRRMKQLVSMGLIRTWKEEDKTYVALTNKGRSALETRNLGFNMPIRFSYRPKRSKFALS